MTDVAVTSGPSTSSKAKGDKEEDYIPPMKKQLSITDALQRKQDYSVGGTMYCLLVKCLLYFICVDKRPFDIVKGRGFKRLMHQACPSFKLPNVDTLKSHLDSFYQVMLNKLQSTFENVSHVALTCDIWTEMMTTTSYLGVTAHYIQNSKVVSRCIATIALHERHTADYINTKLTEICTDLHIALPKITAVVTDNGANMVAGITKFLNRSKHLPCFAHTINLIAESAMSVHAFNDLCCKVREIVKFFKTSVIRSDELRKRQNQTPLKLILDVKTRWNSVYYMLERYVTLAPLVHQILMMNTTAPPTPTAIELQEIKTMLTILKPLEHVTKEISGEQYVTISKVIPIVNCLKTQIQNIDVSASPLAKSVQSTLLSKIGTRFGPIEDNYFLAASCLLDPKFKSLHFQDPRACSNAIAHIRRLCTNMQETHSSETDSDSSAGTTVAYDFWSHHKTLAHNKQKKGSERESLFLKPDEVSLYLSNPVAPLSTDPLAQWEDMRNTFPCLYKIAQELLTIPATSVPSERLFSKAGATMTKIRNRLASKRLNKLLFLGDCTEDEWEL